MKHKPPATRLKGLFSTNAAAATAWERLQARHLNGIACPECGKELHDDPSVSLLTIPPRVKVRCEACRFEDWRVKLPEER